MPVLQSVPLEETKSRSNLSNIDVFRGVAALMVAAYHTREMTWVGIREFWHMHGLQLSPTVVFSYLTFPMLWGGIGVPIFFVISGYCIHRSQAFARAQTGSYKLTILNFLIRRFFRIYPVLFGALTITFICDYIRHQYFPNSTSLGDTGDTGIYAFLINLASLQGVAGGTYGSNGALWTLSIEVQFYLLYPILLVAMARFGRLSTLWILVVLNVVSYFALERFGYRLFSSYYVSWYLGALVAEYQAICLFSKPTQVLTLGANVYAFAIVLLPIGCGVYFFTAYGAFQLWAVAFAVFLYNCLSSQKEPLGWTARFLSWVGTFSFSLYIIHVPIVALIHSVFFSSVRQISLGPFCVALTVAIACAFAFSFIFERPALALSQAWKGQRYIVRPAGPTASAGQLGSD